MPTSGRPPFAARSARASAARRPLEVAGNDSSTTVQPVCPAGHGVRPFRGGFGVGLVRVVGGSGGVGSVLVSTEETGAGPGEVSGTLGLVAT
jgi:hypothetical protein